VFLSKVVTKFIPTFQQNKKPETGVRN